MEHFARSRPADGLAELVFDKDVTSLLRAACAELPTSGMLCTPEFTVDMAMNAIELLDPKLDSRSHVRALVPLAARIADGSLPTARITHAQALAAMDKLLQLEVSWLQGQSMPQSVLSCAYAHPVALQAMRALTGLPPYTTSVGPDFRFNDHPEVVATLPTRPARAVDAPAAVSAQPPLAPGSVPHALVGCVLAFTTGGLKSLDSAHRALFAADCAREEDFASLTFGADCAWTVPAEEVVAQLAAAEAGVWAALPPGDVSAAVAQLAAALAPVQPQGDAPAHGSGAAQPCAATAAAPPPQLAVTAAGWLHAALALPPPGVAAAAAVPPPVDGAPPDAALTAEHAAGCVARLRYRRVHLAVHALLSWPARHPPAAAARASRLAHGACYDLRSVALGARAAIALLGLIEATSPLYGGGGARAAARETAFADAPLSGDLEHGANPHYAKLLISGHYRVVRHPPLASVVGLWRRHWAHVHAITQLPALASHNPHRPYWPSDVVAPGGGGGGGPSEPDMGGGVPRINHGGYAPATAPLKLLAAAAESLARMVPSGTAVPGVPGPFAPGADPGAMADIPASGILDPPLDWPTAAGSTPAAAAASSSSAGAGAEQQPRQHVSLHALLEALERFSRRSPDALSRSWLLMVLMEQAQSQLPPAAAAHEAPLQQPGDAPREQEEAACAAGDSLAPGVSALSLAAAGSGGSSSSSSSSGGGSRIDGGAAAPDTEAAPPPPPAAALPVPFLDEYADWRSAHTASAVVLGTHTLQELARGALVDAGAHPDLLASVEGRRFVSMLDRVFATLLALLCRSRLRMRRQMDAQFKDWAFILGEAGYLDDTYRTYVSLRCAEADGAFIAAGGAHAAAAPPPQPAPARAAHAKQPPPPPSGAAAAAAAPPRVLRQAHRQLSIMRLASPVQTALAQWATGVVRWLQRLHTAVGAESGVFHDDERLALYWHVECMVTALRRSVDRSDGVLALLAALPDARLLSGHARATLASGRELVLHQPTADLSPVEEEPQPQPGGGEGAQRSSGAGDAAAPAAAVGAAAVPPPHTDDVGAAAADTDGLPSLKQAAAAAALKSGGGGGKKGAAAAKSAAAAAKQQQQEEEAVLARLVELLDEWLGPARAQLAVFFGPTASAAARQPNRCGALLDAHAQLCSALLRLLQGTVQLGLLRGLHCHVPPALRDAVRRHAPNESIRMLPGVGSLLYAAPHVDASLREPPASVRCDGRTYDTRWRDVGLVPDAPLPPWHKYVDAMCHTGLSQATAVGWLAEAGGLLRASQASLAQVAALAKAALAGDATALGWRRAAPAAAPPAPGGGAASGGGGGSGGGGKKGAGGKKAGGGGSSKKGSSAFAGGGGASEEEEPGALPAVAAAGAAALHVDGGPPLPLPSCTTSWDVLHAGFDASEAQRLGRVAVANLLLLASMGKDVEGVLRTLPPSAPPPPPEAAAGAAARASGAGGAPAHAAVSMLDTSVLTGRAQWADAGVALQLATQYDAVYVVAKLGRAAVRGAPS